MLGAFPKIFTIGQDYIRDIFNEDVEITEKVDGSQFAFGKIGGLLHMRSKGAILYPENPEKMFARGITYVQSIEDRLPEGIIFYTEYLNTKNHNTLRYERVPKNHLMLFGVMHVNQKFELDLQSYADLLEIEAVPVLHCGKIESAAVLANIMDVSSVLGGCKAEGVVVKNYQRQFFVGGQLMPLMTGKFVCESFKEVHRERWGAEERGKGRLETFFESFKTEARWQKAIQHLQERSELTNAPKDIGRLVKEVQMDIEVEEANAVKEWLWKEYKGQLMRTATAGLPEWYKNRLMESSFEE